MKILVTGGSGFLGKALIRRLGGNVRVLSRNEGQLIALKEMFPNIEIMTGCISDEFICKEALEGIEQVYHLAAFKHVGQAEQQPYQCVNANLIGTMNLLRLFNKGKFIAISTDKAAQVAGVYGASKLLMERVISEYEQINKDVEYRVVRYGNVLYSTGSVLVKWKEALLNGKDIIVTEPTATRYFWTVESAIDLIFECLEKATDSKPYCPEMKSIQVSDLLEAMQYKYGRANAIHTIGLQAGENLHEKILENGLDSSQAQKYTIDEIKELI
jgi:UDP-N-acetylglucosamine 4,6-dehydratase/5-epimerase